MEPQFSQLQKIIAQSERDRLKSVQQQSERDRVNQQFEGKVVGYSGGQVQVSINGAAPILLDAIQGAGFIQGEFVSAFLPYGEAGGYVDKLG